MEKYSKAVSEMYAQFKQKEAHPMEKYIGRFARYLGKKLEVVGYSYIEHMAEFALIVGTSTTDGWHYLGPQDVVFKKCESYFYVGTSALID